MANPWDGKPDPWRKGYQEARDLISPDVSDDLDYQAGYRTGLFEKITEGAITANRGLELTDALIVKDAKDLVEVPEHYTSGKIDVANFITDQQLNYPKGNVVKYVARAGKKDPEKELEDLEKAAAYLQMAYNLARGLPAVVYSADGSVVWDLFRK